MNPGLWGAASALALGSADFTARFSARALGAPSALFGVLVAGAAVLSAWAWLAAPPLVWTAAGLWLIAANGVATSVMTLLLYHGLARGPVGVVAPIVASYPVLVVAFWVALGARPDGVAWLAMAATVVGVVVVARSAERLAEGRGTARAALRATVLIALAASLAHAVLVVAGQAAVAHYGEFQVLWLGRLFGLAAVVALFAVRRRVPKIPPRWWPVLALQGALDAGGYLCLFMGSKGEGNEIAAVAASTFGAVTTLLARVVLKERVGRMQWAGIALVFAGVAVLAGRG